METFPDGFAVAVARRVQQVATENRLWPGFNPADVPLAIYDGTETLLYGYPGTPDGFVPRADDGQQRLVYQGRHPAVVANTCVDLDGTLVATVMPATGLNVQHPGEAAGLAIHEMFHVFQMRNPALWKMANEAVMFLYPLTDTGLVELRRREVEALRRALGSQSLPDKIGWARQALHTRKARFSQLDGDFISYERRVEVIEGLAHYVEAAAGGRPLRLPASGFSLADFRLSLYATGHTLAALLDDVKPGWQQAVMTETEWALDVVLAAALQSAEDDASDDDAAKYAFSAKELATFANLAEDDVRTVVAERAARLHEFRTKPGQRLVIETAVTEPLRVAGFDPMNVHVLDAGVLHTRLLHLGNSRNRIEMLRTGGRDAQALTEGLGPHPLFNGIRRVEFVVEDGLHVVTATDGNTISITSGSITATLHAAATEETPSGLRAILAASSPPRELQ